MNLQPRLIQILEQIFHPTLIGLLQELSFSESARERGPEGIDQRIFGRLDVRVGTLKWKVEGAWLKPRYEERAIRVEELALPDDVIWVTLSRREVTFFIMFTAGAAGSRQGIGLEVKVSFPQANWVDLIPAGTTTVGFPLARLSQSCLVGAFLRAWSWCKQRG